MWDSGRPFDLERDWSRRRSRDVEVAGVLDLWPWCRLLVKNVKLRESEKE